MDLDKIAIRIAGLHSARYLDEPIEVSEEKLQGWPRTPEGQDLLFLFGEIRKKSKTKEIPNLLRHLTNSANEVLLYLQDKK